MSRRNKMIKVSPESVALKEMREKANLSLRKLADLMDLSFTRVHQMESGKENVNEEYVRKFLNVTGHTNKEGRDFFSLIFNHIIKDKVILSDGTVFTFQRRK